MQGSAGAETTEKPEKLRNQNYSDTTSPPRNQRRLRNQKNDVSDEGTRKRKANTIHKQFPNKGLPRQIGNHHFESHSGRPPSISDKEIQEYQSGSRRFIDRFIHAGARFLVGFSARLRRLIFRKKGVPDHFETTT